MAFANLFSSLSAVRDHVNTETEYPRRSENDDWKRADVKKRKRQSEQTWSKKKRQHDLSQESRASNPSVLKDHQKKTADGGRVCAGFAGGGVHGQGNQGAHHAVSRNSQSRKAHNVNNQRQQGGNNKNKKYKHHSNEQWRRANGGGGNKRQTWKPGRFAGDRDNKQDAKVKRARPMTQEFKDQHVIVVNDQMLCRYFLFGKCIKGDECQLEHAEGFNDLIKKICKFYVQGLCTKGDKCPYMHKSFPCKFFHEQGRCPHREGCRFSHDPLNDTTKPLLEEVLRADELLREQAQKAEQASAEQPTNAEEPEGAEVTESPDILTQPFKLNFYNSGESVTFRPNFYNSEGANAAAEEAKSRPPDMVPDTEEEAYQAHETHLQPRDSASEPPRSGEGASGDRNESGLSPTPGCEDSPSVSVQRKCPSPAPYSVEAVFRACKSLHGSTLSSSTASTAETPAPEVNSVPQQTSGEGPMREKCSPSSRYENGPLPPDDPHGAGSSVEAPQSSGKVLISLFSKPPTAVSPPNRSPNLTSSHSLAPPPSQSFFKGDSGTMGCSQSTEPTERGLKPVTPHLSGTPARPFRSLFASSIIGASAPDSAGTPAPGPSDSRGDQTAPRTGSLRGLFATPLAGIAPQPGSVRPPADLDASPPRPLTTGGTTRTRQGEGSANQPRIESQPPTSRKELSTVGSSAAAASTSVLKGLFVSLGPFQPDRQTQGTDGRSDASERQRDQQRPPKKNSRKKKTV